MSLTEKQKEHLIDSLKAAKDDDYQTYRNNIINVILSDNLKHSDVYDLADLPGLKDELVTELEAIARLMSKNNNKIPGHSAKTAKANEDLKQKEPDTKPKVSTKTKVSFADTPTIQML